MSMNPYEVTAVEFEALQRRRDPLRFELMSKSQSHRFTLGLRWLRISMGCGGVGGLCVVGSLFLPHLGVACLISLLLFGLGLLISTACWVSASGRQRLLSLTSLLLQVVSIAALTLGAAGLARASRPPGFVMLFYASSVACYLLAIALLSAIVLGFATAKNNRPAATLASLSIFVCAIVGCIGSSLSLQLLGRPLFNYVVILVGAQLLFGCGFTYLASRKLLVT